MYGHSGPQGANAAPQGGSTTSTLFIPTTLPEVSNFIRYVVAISEGDTRVAASTGGIGWSIPPDPAYPNVFCVGDGGSPPCDFRIDFTDCNGDDIWALIANPHVQPGHFSYAKALNYEQVVVQPLALTQLKVLPYTLLYAPPGNASSASYQTTGSYGINMSFDNKNANNQSVTVDNKGQETTALGLTVGGGGMVGGISLSGAFGWNMTNTNGWDTGTKAGTGAISDFSTSQVATESTSIQFTLSSSTLTPGANETRAQEPYWGDEFILLVHPQMALWRLGDTPVVSLIGAAGTPSSPRFVEPSVTDLDKCVKGQVPFVTGYPILDTGDVLTSSECAGLLALDPLYVAGQSFPGATTNNRFLLAGSTEYGIDPALPSSDLKVTFSQSLVLTNTTVVQSVGSYTATITDILTTADTDDVTFKAAVSIFGLNLGDTLTNTETQTTSSDWTLTLSTSYTATAQSSWVVSGVMDDHHGLMGTTALPYRPRVNFYRDAVFGSFLFQDPSAP